MKPSPHDEPGPSGGGFWGKLLSFLLKSHEVIATILMGSAALVTAWCAFEATIWSGEQSKSFAKASGARTESTRNELLDHQFLQIDVATFLSWLEAVDRENGGNLAGKGPYQPDETRHSGFLFHRMRPDFRPALEAWVATRPLINPDAPPSPFLMDAYRRPRADKAAALMEDAERQIEAGLKDNVTSDSYMLVTVLSSMVIFFAGLSSKLTMRVNGLGMLIMACLAFMACVVAIIRLPVTFF